MAYYRSASAQHTAPASPLCPCGNCIVQMDQDQLGVHEFFGKYKGKLNMGPRQTVWRLFSSNHWVVVGPFGLRVSGRGPTVWLGERKCREGRRDSGAFCASRGTVSGRRVGKRRSDGGCRRVVSRLVMVVTTLVACHRMISYHMYS